jgi:SUMO ligase MMS21 Smc5/6 complex component
MNWCNQNNLLSDEGEEILEFGIDDSISIHSRLLNKRGNLFMEKYYDTFISANSEHSSEMDEKLKTL